MRVPEVRVGGAGAGAGASTGALTTGDACSPSDASQASATVPSVTGSKLLDGHIATAVECVAKASLTSAQRVIARMRYRRRLVEEADPGLAGQREE